MNIKNRKKLFKKLLFQSNNLSCREMNLIIGQFTKMNLSKLNDSELKELETILQIDEIILYEWYVKKTIVPDYGSLELMLKILDFKPDINNKI